MKKTTILVIEDNPPNLELMRYLLTAYGYEVLAARDGQEGIEVALEALPDLIISDIQMPHLSGYDVVESLKRRDETRHIPLLAVTALAMVGDKDKMLQAGFDGYISKPLDPERFVSQISSFLSPRLRSHSIPAQSFSQDQQQAAPSVEQRAMILVIDNLQLNIQLLCSTLEPSGYKVLQANDIATALELLQRSTPDLILSDYHMPGQQGADFFQILQTLPQFRAIPFVFISSTGDPEAITEELKFFAGLEVEVLARPIEPELLLERIDELLSKAREQKAESGEEADG